MTKPHWHFQLDEWNRLGVLKRLEEAREAQEIVKVRRSDLSIDEGHLDGGGFGGRMVTVKLLGRDLWKNMPTDEFLELNPHLGPALLEPA